MPSLYEAYLKFRREEANKRTEEKLLDFEFEFEDECESPRDTALREFLEHMAAVRAELIMGAA